MQKLLHLHPKQMDAGAERGSDPEKIKTENGKKRSMKIIRECARKEGVLLSKRLWAHLEKTVHTNYKW